MLLLGAAALPAAAQTPLPPVEPKASCASLPAKLYQTWAGAKLFESGYRQECALDGPDFVCRPKS